MERRHWQAPVNISIADQERLAASALQLQKTIEDLLAVMQEIDRRDHGMMVNLREKYALPQRASAISEAVSGFMRVLKTVVA